MLFSYNNLEIKISPATKSLFIEIIPEHLDLETLFELESLTHWLQSHIEVQSVVITNSHELFVRGPQAETLGRWTSDQLRKFQQKLARVVWSFNKIPQTVIAETKRGTDCFGVELLFAADIVTIDTEGEISFDYLKRGLTPMSGGISLLAEAVGTARARQWMLTSKNVKASELEHSGWAMAVNDREQIVDLLKTIATQSQVARIQMKRQWLEWSTPTFEKIEEVEYPFALAAHETADFQRPHKKEKFVEAKEVARNLRERNFEDQSL